MKYRKDHSPVKLTISEKIIERENQSQGTYKNTIWKILTHLIEQGTDLKLPVKSHNQIQEKVELLINNIQNLAWF